MMIQSEKVKLLSQTLLFSSLNEEELNALAEIAVEKYYPPSTYIFWEGDMPERFYLLTAGQVKIIKHSTQGREVIIAFFGPGEMFGEVAIFENKEYPASAQATTQTTVLAIERQDLLSFLSNQPEVAMRIINILGGRLRDAQNRLRDFAVERVEQRISRTLLMLYSKIGVELPFTRQEIADMSGTAMETAIRFMSQLKERKIIDSTRGKIIIVNEEKLRLLSDGYPRI